MDPEEGAVGVGLWASCLRVAPSVLQCLSCTLVASSAEAA